MAKGPGRHFTKEDIQITTKYIKKYSTPFVISEMQTKITSTYYYGMAKIKQMDNEECGTIQTLVHCWWEYIFIQLLWKMAISTKTKYIPTL